MSNAINKNGLNEDAKRFTSLKISIRLFVKLLLLVLCVFCFSHGLLGQKKYPGFKLKGEGDVRLALKEMESSSINLLPRLDVWCKSQLFPDMDYVHLIGGKPLIVSKGFDEKNGKAIFRIERIYKGERHGSPHFKSLQIVKEKTSLVLNQDGSVKGHSEFEILQDISIIQAPLSADFTINAVSRDMDDWTMEQCLGPNSMKTPAACRKKLKKVFIKSEGKNEIFELLRENYAKLHDVNCENPEVGRILVKCCLAEIGKKLLKGTLLSLDYGYSANSSELKSQQGKEDSQNVFPVWAKVRPCDLRAGKLYLLADFPVQVQFKCNGFADKVKDPKLLVEMDSRVKLHGAYFLGRYSFIEKYQMPIKWTQERMGENIKYTFDLSSKYFPANLDPQYEFPRSATVCLFLSPSETISEESELKWRFVSNGKTSAQKKITIPPSLPSLNLAPKENRFFSGIFSSEFLNAKNEEIRQKFLSLYKAWNVRWINSRLDKVSKQKAKDADLKVVSWITHMSGFQGLSSEDVTGRKDIDLRTVLNDGSRSRHKCQLCPQYAIDHGKKGDDFFEAFKKVIKKQIDENASAVGYDYEPWSPDRGMLRSCFCPRCMKAFAAFSGLPESECVPEKILKYKDKWIKFRCWQNAAVYKVFCGIVRDINPDVKIFFASSKVFLPETRDRFLQWEGVDLTNCKEYDELTDLHTPMIYSNGATFYKDVEIASNTLSKPLFPVICPGDGVVAFMSADMIVMNIMAALAHDCKGIYIYPGAWELDGQCLSKITEAFGIIKDVEKFVYDGKKDKNLSIKPYPGKLVKAVSSDGKEIEIQVPDWSKLFFSKAFTLDGELLAFLFNYHQSLDCFVKIKTESLESGKQWQIFDLFRNAWVGKRFYSTEELKTGIVFKCAPERVSLLKISSYNKDDETNCILPASKAPEVKVEKLSGSLADKDSKISWASQGGDLCLRLSLPSQTVVINPDHGARIWSWTPKGACELVAANTGERGSGLARDMFWQPRSGRWSKDQDSRYLFEKSSLTDEYASAIFSRKLVSNNFSGIEIVKEFRAFKKRPEIEVIVTVANQSERDFSFIFWMHNHPVIREQLIATQALDPKNALYLEIPMEGGKKHLTGPLAKGESIFFEGNSNNKDGLYRETAGNLNEGYLLEYCNLTGEALKFSFDNNKLLQAYHWRGTVPTIEFMFGKTTLAPGKEWSEKVKMEYIKKYDLKDLKILK